MIHCVDCGHKLYDYKTATRCRPCANAYKAPEMYGFQHSDETLAVMTQKALIQRAEASGREPMTRERIAELRRLRASGVKGAELARRFGIGEAHVSVYLRFDSYADYRRYQQRPKESA